MVSVPEERRQFRRTKLRLRINRLHGLETARHGGLWTVDVSAGGMFFHAPLVKAPQCGDPVTFQLHLPPGEGYLPSEARIRGSGKIVRAVPAGQDTTGVAIQFNRPLALEF